MGVTKLTRERWYSWGMPKLVHMTLRQVRIRKLLERRLARQEQKDDPTGCKLRAKIEAQHQTIKELNAALEDLIREHWALKAECVQLRARVLAEPEGVTDRTGSHITQ